MLKTLKKMTNKAKALLLGAVAVGSSAFAADGITYNKATTGNKRIDWYDTKRNRQLL